MAEAVATPAPVDECRELGGGWQWHGTREHGTSFIGLEGDELGFDAQSGDATVSDLAIDPDEFADRVEEREAAGWSDGRLQQLHYLGSDYERAVELLRYTGDRDEYEQLIEGLETRLDEMPICDLEPR